MLHVTELLDVVKKAHIFHLCSQDENPETSPTRNPGVLDNSHQQFKHFQYLSLTGPHQAVSQIQVLCRRWLQPETHTKEQIIERLVLEQFLSTLPEEIQKWVRSKQPENSSEAGMLVANLIQACEDPDPCQERSHSNDEFSRHSNLTQQSEDLPGEDPQECSVTGMGTRPQPVQLFRCKICERAFSTNIGLVRHEPIHTGKKPFECKQCGEAFFLMPHLTRHQKSHASDKPSLCSKGAKSLIQRADLSHQVRTHSQEDYYERVQHGKAFIQEVRLSQHLKGHNTAKALSPVLPHNKTYLIRYQREHDYVRQTAHQCCDCGKTFGHSSHLVQHY
ncbi:Zinc finger imprinted 2 [Heterocephalus glaber]|uniref:Zinc finger imprinted 2 n=1 Tax=Heterocephalus glaber TaxID=10181 RepID=G5CAU3_HETGA|nr:Zinc finger imprinted 2 [Heterocephalus glaber]